MTIQDVVDCLAGAMERAASRNDMHVDRRDAPLESHRMECVLLADEFHRVRYERGLDHWPDPNAPRCG